MEDPSAQSQFPSSTEGLLPSAAPALVEVEPGGTYDLRIGAVVKQLGSAQVRMLAYNGSIPGPTLKVRQGSEIVVRTENAGDLEATVHWHGLRLENRHDGTHETQRPMEVGERFDYRLKFPDPGVYWYHPHIREDYAQELGLYGNILVVPEAPDYWPPAHRELLVTLDDVLLAEGRAAPFSREQTNYSAMGRFGNTMLVAGEPELRLDAQSNEVVRFYFTNTANARVFNVGFTGARMKLVGGDGGRCEREEFVDSVVLAPSERAVVDVLFGRPGEAGLEHRTPERTYALGRISVSDEPAPPGPAEAFELLRENEDMLEERGRIAPYLKAEPDKSLGLVAEIEFERADSPAIYVCPMHPEVISREQRHCPQCGMRLVPMPKAFICPMHLEVASDEPGNCPRCGMKLLPAAVVAAGIEQGGEGMAMAHGQHGRDRAAAGGIEWEDDMAEVNRTTTAANTRWKIVDRETGAENADIAWRFTVGERVKIRLVNEMDSDHPMHHPFHIHGAGRFLVLARDGEPEPNLVWKDTVLVRTGEVVDLLLEPTNPGRWMAHCHIAEHHESGMHFSFDVAAQPAPRIGDDPNAHHGARLPAEDGPV